MTSTKLTQAGHTLCVDRVRIPQFGQPGTPGQWIWWVRHPNGKLSGEEHTLCFDPLDDSELRKAHSAASHQLELAKIRGVLEFDELDWEP